MPASTSRRAGPIKPIEFATIAVLFVGRMPLERAEHSADFCFDFARATTRAWSHGGQERPPPRGHPGVAEGAEEGGRSCPLSRRLTTAGRTIEAANSRSNVVEPPALR